MASIYTYTQFSGVMMEIISRKEAASKGLSKFFTGRKCKNGHVAERYVCNGVCVTCNFENSTSYRSVLKQLINSAK